MLMYIYIYICICLYIYIYIHIYVNSPGSLFRENRHGSTSAMRWLRSLGSIKLSVSFAEYCLFYRALLQKRPIILSILLTEATPHRCRGALLLAVFVYVYMYRCIYIHICVYVHIR